MRATAIGLEAAGHLSKRVYTVSSEPHSLRNHLRILYIVVKDWQDTSLHVASPKEVAYAISLESMQFHFFLRTLHTLHYICLTSRAYRHPDSYHTCYALVGLSNLQYYHYHTDVDGDTKLGGAFASSFSWESIPMGSVLENKGEHFLDGIDGLTPFHPIYSIPHQAAKDIRLWSQAQASW